MLEVPVIIAGGGPAGSTCARELKKHGIEAAVLDKESFPRTKLCAGWITPRVLEDLDIDPARYPHRLGLYRRILFRFRQVPLPLPTRQYCVRRYEFDDFLLRRAGVPVYKHHVRQIRRENHGYTIDGQYRCTYLVGAGGTHCPVRRNLFSGINSRDRSLCIATAEDEFDWQWEDPECRLWFFDHGLAGYSWYVPKPGGWLNVGIGGKFAALKKRGETINTHWRLFEKKLRQKGLVKGRRLSPRGHVYYLRGSVRNTRLENAFLIGDSAGLATRDMGEGIGPAVESGIIAARAIARGAFFSLDAVTRWSAPALVSAGFARKKISSGTR